MDEIIVYRNQNELYHHGILGQKWGIRRYQNYDGTLTDKGRKRRDNMSEDKQISFDKKTAKELKKHTLSAEENLKKYAKEEASKNENLKEARAAYEDANKTYLRNANSLFGKGISDADRHNLNSIEDNYNNAKKSHDEAKTNLEIAEKVYDNYASKYKKTIDSLIEKCGSDAIDNYSTKTVQMGKDYVKDTINFGQYGFFTGQTKYDKTGTRSQKEYVNENVDTLMRDYKEKKDG